MRGKLLNAVLSLIKDRSLRHVIYVAVGATGAWLITNLITFDALDPMVSSLQNVSMAMFTLAGSWIAISYPQAISAYTDPEKLTLLPSSNTKRIVNLVLIILTSAFVMGALLSLEWAYVFTNAIFIDGKLRGFFKFLGVASLI